MSSRKRNTIALGTSPDFCFVRDDTLVVPFLGFDATAFPGLRQDVCFTYEKPTQATEAAERIAEWLVSGADERSKALRSEYSNANLLEFLARHLSRDGLMFMRWTGLVKLESTGLFCFLPSETWDTMHVEDLVDSAIEWQRGTPDSDTAASGGVAAHKMFGLNPRITWLARAKVSRPIADTNLFPW